MLSENMNLDALKRVTDFVVGADGTAVIAATYHMVAAAMQAGYNEGYQTGRYEAEENVEDRLDNAFDEGFEQGVSFQQVLDADDTERAVSECFDDGYLEGVADARARPGIADAEVQDIINSRAEAAFDALEAQAA